MTLGASATTGRAGAGKRARAAAALALRLPLAAAGRAAAELPPRHREWFELASPLLSAAERDAFIALKRDYQRDAFIERFWRVRDPFPETPQNGFRETWTARAAEARELFGTLAGDRARMMLFYGPPADRRPAVCPELVQPLEVWFYSGNERMRGEFFLVFYRAVGSPDPYRAWSPRHGLASILTWVAAPALDERSSLQRILDTCPQGGEIVAALQGALDWELAESRGEPVPRPDPEWVAAFEARSTELPEGADRFSAALEVGFPGRHQSRTAVQALIRVPSAEAGLGATAGRQSYTFLLDGEVLRKGELFEHFRYRFDLPAESVAGDEIPLALERHLRPGDYTLVLKIEDLNTHRFFREEHPLVVPMVAAAAAAAALAPAEEVPLAAPLVVPGLLAEANANRAGADEHTLRILPPPPELLTGRLRVDVTAAGERLAKVAFRLDGRPVMTKTRPPFSVELDLGAAPRLHTLEAVALDGDGGELARDEVLLNAGAQSFSLRLIEPRPGGTYAQSLRANAEVEVPAGEALDRVEFYLNETRLATLFQPPFTQPIVLSAGEPVNYVRAVAYLGDGHSAEDVVFVNAPDYVDRVQVNLVELFTSAVDRRGRPVEGLVREEFTVLEDGVVQEIRRFELVRDLPIHAGILLDTSTSMIEELREAERAALRFFEAVLTAKDRAAVITFNDRPNLAVPFTNSVEVLAGGLAELVAEGETALHDSLLYALYYFSGLRGKRAIVLISDGEDSRSRYGFDEALEYARHAGVAVYTVGLAVGTQSREARMKLERLAAETGGRSFFVDRAAQLAPTYERIQEELRSQYLIAYQSSAGGGSDFRQVEIKVGRSGVQAKTIRGYYP